MWKLTSPPVGRPASGRPRTADGVRCSPSAEEIPRPSSNTGREGGSPAPFRSIQASSGLDEAHALRERNLLYSLISSSNTFADTPRIMSKYPGACSPAKLPCKVYRRPVEAAQVSGRAEGPGPAHPGASYPTMPSSVPRSRMDRTALAQGSFRLRGRAGTRPRSPVGPPVGTRILPSLVPVLRPSACFSNFPQKFASEQSQ